MRWGVGLAGCFLASALAVDHPRSACAQMVNFTDLGMGTFSCATAEQSDNFVYSEQWLAGYFGGVNVNNNLDHNVGSGTDMAGIMGEVQLECSAYPSEHFSKAVGNVYNKLQQEGR